MNDNWIDTELAELRKGDLERSLIEYSGSGGVLEVGGKRIVNFSSNDYLALACDPRVVDAAKQALEQYGAGSGSSRLVTGTFPIHSELEAAIAEHKGYPTALVYGTGYMTNAGVMSVIVGKDDHVFADRLCHASIIDASILSRAKLHRFRHNDPEHLDELLSGSGGGGRSLVVTESVFSMDGDIAPLADIAAVAGKYEAMLMVDEAHATGVLGPGGAGLVRELSLESDVDISMGTLSKALGSFGGYVACSAALRDLLINRSRSFMYSTALPPASAAAALASLKILQDEPGCGAELLKRAECFRQKLKEAGLDTGNSATQIIPVIVGDNQTALDMSRALLADGIIATAIRPPTVPVGKARIRFSVTLAHSESDLAQSADIILRTVGKDLL